MTHAQLLRIKKLTGKSIIQVAAKHNLREILTEYGAGHEGHIDPSRAQFNYVLRGPDTAASVANAARSLLDNAGIKTLRKDAVQALEIIFSLSPQVPINHREYFTDATIWAESHFNAPIISATVHLDEAAPHCHVLVLPLINGRMIGSDLMGSRAKLLALQSDFYAQVGQRY